MHSSSTWLAKQISQILFSKGSFFQRPVSTLKLFVPLLSMVKLAHNLSFDFAPPSFCSWCFDLGDPACLLQSAHLPTWPQPNCSRSFVRQFFLSPLDLRLLSAIKTIFPKSKATCANPARRSPLRCLFSCSLHPFAQQLISNFRHPKLHRTAAFTESSVSGW